MKDEGKRNPGPSCGYQLILFFYHLLPRFIFNACLAVGSFIAMTRMPSQRQASREYLKRILGRPPRITDIWRHFNTFAHTLAFRLIVSGNKEPRLILPHWHGEEFMELARSGRQMLYGSFHIGCGELLGYSLSKGFCPVYMIRQRVGNSHDTERFARSYSGVKILWTNETGEMLFGINKAIGEGASIAMQCDRSGYCSRSSSFTFLGRDEEFPVTIYHLSAIYNLPVAFCFAIFNGREVETFAPKPFIPEGTRAQIMSAGHEHFQQVLRDVERLLNQYPYHWFNFEPRNDAVASVQQDKDPATGNTNVEAETHA